MAAGVLLAIAVAAGALIWIVSARGAVPPNRDSTNHGYFAARIARENTLDASVVLAESPTNPTPVAEYYPLTLHTQIATTHRLTGLTVADLLTAAAAAAVIIYLPLGVFGLTRRLLPARPEAAGFAALVSTTVAVFPYQPVWWGGITLVIGLALVPGALCLSLVATRSPRASSLSVAALAVAGTILVHPSQLALLVVVLAAFAAQDLLRARAGHTGRTDATPPTSTPAKPASGLMPSGADEAERPGMPVVVRNWALFGAACAVLLIPSVLDLATGASERAEHSAARADSVVEGLRRLITLDLENGSTQPVLGLLALVGFALALRHRRLRPLLAVTGAMALLFLASTVGGALWEVVSPATSPWYRSWWRLLYNVALFLPILVALVLDEARRILSGPLPRWAATAVLALVPLVVFAPSAAATLQLGFAHQALLDQSDLDVMTRLARRGGSGEVILNQENDATTWMYAVAGLRSFSGIQGFDRSGDAEDRDYLLEHLSDAPSDPRVRELLERWNIRFVMVNDRAYKSEKRAMYPDELLRTPGFAVVDHGDSLWVLEVDSKSD